MFSTTVDLSSHWDMRGLAAARMEVLALRVQMIPALAMDRVCCSWRRRDVVFISWTICVPLINPRCACAARDTVVGFVCVCVCVKSHLTSQMSNRAINQRVYSVACERQKNLWGFV